MWAFGPYCQEKYLDSVGMVTVGIHIIDLSVGRVFISGVYGLITMKVCMNVGFCTLMSGKKYLDSVTMATVAIVNKILSQSQIMATMALELHMDGCRRVKRDDQRYLLPWKPNVTIATKICIASKQVASCPFSLPSLALDLSMNC